MRYAPQYRSEPTRLTPSELRKLRDPVTLALTALRLETADQSHIDDLKAAVHLGYRIAGVVQRHRHAIPSLKAASDAIQHMEADRPFRIDDIDAGAQVYLALLTATPRAVIKRAINQAYKEATENVVQESADLPAPRAMAHDGCTAP